MLKKIGKMLEKIIVLGAGVCCGFLMYRIIDGTILNKKDTTTVEVGTYDEDTQYDVPADMSGYRFLEENEGNGFILEKIKTANNVIQNGTALIYIGYENCQWCQRAVPVLQDVANTENMAIMYVDVGNVSEDETDDYDEMVELLSDYLEYNDDGNKTLYTPMVVAVKDGEIKSASTGLIDSFTITDETSYFTDEQYQEQFKIYDDMAKSILSE